MIGVPDLTDFKKQAFINRLFLSGQLNPVQLCATIANLKTNSNLYPGIDKFSEVPSELNENNALEHLAEEFVKLHSKQLSPKDEHYNFLLDHGLVEDPKSIRELSKAQKESFLYHAAYFLQQIQETLHEQNNDNVKTHEETSKEEEEPETDILIPENDASSFEVDDIEMHEIDFATEFLWDTKEVEAAVPLNSMMTPLERKWFTEYASYISGKPRCITRVVNCYNLARYVAEKVTPETLYKNAINLKRKLMKLIILSEFWPYRTAFLMQVAVSFYCPLIVFRKGTFYVDLNISYAP